MSAGRRLEQGMRERPILFSGPMVQAIRAGAKRQTRRVFKARNGGVWPRLNDLPGMQQVLRTCPYGRPGDRLWVRETHGNLALPGYAPVWTYRADVSEGEGWNLPTGFRWMPSIHMPRAASRITLVLTGVRLERLQEISPDDCIAEGAWPIEQRELGRGNEAVMAFRRLWSQINGSASWDADPFVWVLDFDLLTENAISSATGP